MNKFLTLAAACTLALGFTACEDVPAPYGLPTEKQQQQPASKEVLLEESFASSLGSFKNYTTSGEGAWKIDFKTAKASGYDNAAKKTTAGTYYLVSSEIDLTGVDNAYVALDYIMRYNKGDENQQLLITDAFNAEKPAEGWTVVNQKWTEAADWKNFVNDKVAIPAAFLGKKVHIAFRYNTDDKSGSTWEIKNLKVQRGTVTPSTPEQPVQPNTNGPLIDESFAATLGSFTNQTTSGDGAWKVDFKSAKASGYDNASKKTTAGTYYLVSQEVDLTAAKTEGAHVAPTTFSATTRATRTSNSSSPTPTMPTNPPKDGRCSTKNGQKARIGRPTLRPTSTFPPPSSAKKCVLPSATTATTRAVPHGKSRT